MSCFFLRCICAFFAVYLFFPQNSIILHNTWYMGTFWHNQKMIPLNGIFFDMTIPSPAPISTPVESLVYSCAFVSRGCFSTLFEWILFFPVSLIYGTHTLCIWLARTVICLYFFDWFKDDLQIRYPFWKWRQNSNIRAISGLFWKLSLKRRKNYQPMHQVKTLTSARVSDLIISVFCSVLHFTCFSTLSPAKLTCIVLEKTQKLIFFVYFRSAGKKFLGRFMQKSKFLPL